MRRRRKVFYPMLDEKKEKRIPVCRELIQYGEDTYFFSPHFKKSEEVIDGILRGYVQEKGKGRGFFQKSVSVSELVVRPSFKSEDEKKCKKILSRLNQEDVGLKYEEIIAYTQNKDFFVFLTKDRLVSDYRHDKDHDKAKVGKYVDCLIRDLKILHDKRTFTYNDKQFTFSPFGEDFISLLAALQKLDKEIEPISNEHPLNKEKQSMRENYFGILLDKTLADGFLSANEVIRLEIMAKQLGIDSKDVQKLIRDTIQRYMDYKEADNILGFIHESVSRANIISEKYHYMLYHDVITFELLSDKVKTEERDEPSEFSERLSNYCNLDEEFKKAYAKSMQKLVVASYSLRDTMQERESRMEKGEVEAFANLFDTMEYEYDLQKELLR